MGMLTPLLLRTSPNLKVDLRTRKQRDLRLWYAIVLNN